MKKKEIKTYPNISERIGTQYDDFESLINRCKERAEELLTSPEIVSNRNIDVAFWTKDLPAELIGVAEYREDALGNITYEWDDSVCTL